MTIVIDGTTGISGVDGTASNPSYEGTDSNTGIFYPAADTVAISTGGTEALRVNSSQNVGIGTSSPTSKLHVVGAITATQGVGGTPAFSAQITTTQTITLNVNTKVVFGTEYFDTNSNYDASNGRFTPTVAGYYQINTQVYFPANSTSYAFIEIQKNGSQLAVSAGVTGTSAAVWSAGCVFLKRQNCRHLGREVELSGSDSWLPLVHSIGGKSEKSEFA